MCGIETRKATPHRRKGFADLDVTWVASPSMPPTLRTERPLLEPYTPRTKRASSLCSRTPECRSGWVTALLRSSRPGPVRAHLHEGLCPGPVRCLGSSSQRAPGHAEIKPNDVVGGHEIIYALAPTAWGAGLGSELAEAIVAYGFDALGLTRVYATVDPANVASLTLLDGIGFEHVRDIQEDDGSTTHVLARRLTETAFEISHCD